MTCAEISPLYAMLRERPALVETLSPAALALLLNDPEYSLRDDQILPAHEWQSCVTIAGRGFGKTHGTAAECIRQVLSGDASELGLMGPSDERTRQIQVEKLVELSPWWDKPIYSNDELRWSNGARAICFTAEAPKAPRGANLDLVWCTELVAWPKNTALEAWDAITTATRTRACRRILADTTSFGRVPVIIDRVRENERDPENYVLLAGDIFDNPLFDVRYLRAELEKYAGRRRAEELFGKVFTEADGALWEQTWLDTHRRDRAPAYTVRIVSIDPTTTHGEEADETGFIVAERGEDGDVYVRKDRSERVDADTWATRALDECDAGAAGIVIEATGNSGGHYLLPTIRAAARARTPELTIIEWPESNGKPMPRRQAGIVYWREKKARDAKETRAYAPAGLSQAGRVHHVGTFHELEHEQTTWIPGERKSPNRLDAYVYAVLELSGVQLERQRDPKRRAAELKTAHAAFRGLLQRHTKRRL
jgi:phage terminase large subunit-like protein